MVLAPAGGPPTLDFLDFPPLLEAIGPRVVIPMHYNTFDLIKQDAAAFAKLVGKSAEVVILKPGESYNF